MDWKEYALALLLFSGVSMICCMSAAVQQWRGCRESAEVAGVPPAGI